MSDRGRASEPHEHDWRVDPNVILTSNPPQQRLVCVMCGAVSSRFFPGEDFKGQSSNPGDWEKA